MAKRELQVGDVVTFVDATGTPHTSLVTAWWSEMCCNVVYVAGDPEKKDTYGRQIERNTSLLHKDTMGTAHGMYWKWPEEELKPYAPPIAV